MKSHFAYITVLVPLLLSMFTAPAMAAPEEVKVAVYVLNLGKPDLSTGAFTADFYLYFKCINTCPAINYEFINGRATSLEKLSNEPNEKLYRIQVSLNNPMDFSKFPFDTQKLQIIIEDKKATINEINYTANAEESGLDPSVTLGGWNLDGWTAKSSGHHYGFSNQTYPQYEFDISISRAWLGSFLKTFLPVIFILLTVLASFILGIEKINIKLAIAGFALVAVVVFHVYIAGQLPPTGCLTFADKFMIVTYIIILTSLLLNIILMWIFDKGNKDLVEKIQKRTKRMVIPVTTVIYLVLFLFFI